MVFSPVFPVHSIIRIEFWHIIVGSELKDESYLFVEQMIEDKDQHTMAHEPKLACKLNFLTFF